MIDLTTSYLGLPLKNPLVASSSPLTEDLSNLRKMEDAGAAAVVMHSLFEEQITLASVELDHSLNAGTESFAESLSYLPELRHYNLGPDGYLEHLVQAKAAVSIPVIASLNGTSLGGWVKFAQIIEQAGVDGLELNIYYLPLDSDTTGAEVEQSYCDLIAAVRSTVRIPLAVKIGPYFSSLANLAPRLVRAGADALVLFNRFYEPDFDLETLDVVPTVALSASVELLLRLHWVALLHGQIQADLAVTGGVHSAADVLKAMMAGAQVAMMTSALLKNGISHIAKVRVDLLRWMEEHEYESIRQMQGSMCSNALPHPSALSRVNYMRVLSSYRVRKEQEQT